MGAVSVVNFFALFVLLRRQLGFLDGRRILRTAVRALVCAAALAAVSWLVWQQLQGYAAGGFLPLLTAVLIAVAAGAAVYVALARLFKLDELTAVWRALRRRRATTEPSGE
jgi:putative peptidoglycan lipid II flippase